MEESITQIITIAGIVYTIFGIVILVRWWRMTSDIRDIRDHLLNSNSKNESYNQEINSSNKIDSKAEQTIAENAEVLNKLIAKLKPNQCIVKVLANSKVEIWNMSDWEEVVKAGRKDMFQMLFNNYE
ncbi:MAG: hypothetical protein EOM47_07265 [Bacteroidia bacterium]|nr:hypothetical protein [Paludibacter sp.]NCB68632.1 hypothetical protein [Bacteroidia bacterium]